MRIDDTDQERNVAEALQPILDGFRWLGLDWDEGPTDDGTGSVGPHAPYFQSLRREHYEKAVEELLASGNAYRDFSGADYNAEREAAREQKRPFVYSRRWMAEDEKKAAAFEAEGRQAVVRLKMPREGTCRIQDLVRGDVEFSWAEEQDHVVQRGDGTCLYNLATVVDDHAFQISHVIRAVEHLSNTPRQIFIARALGYEVPVFAHLPYVAEPSGTKKLSKRHIKDYLKNRDFQKLYDHGERIAAMIGIQGDADTFNPVLVDFYREVGYLADAIVNYLLLLGWSLDDKTEEFSREQMVEHFSLERVNKSPASFDPQKLLAFQSRAMLAHPIKKKVALVLPYLQKAGWVESPPPCNVSDKLTAILNAANDRIKVAGDILDYPEFFRADDELEYVDKDFEKRLRKPDDASKLLSDFKAVLQSAEPFEASHLETLLKDFVEAQGIKIGQIIHALRVAVTGKSVGLGMFDTLAIIGRESCLARIDRALAML